MIQLDDFSAANLVIRSVSHPDLESQLSRAGRFHFISFHFPLFTGQKTKVHKNVVDQDAKPGIEFLSGEV